MDIDFRSGELCLQHNRPIRLSDARDMDIICTDGKIWITADGEAGDTFLNSGESFRVRSTGRVLVESLGAGKIRLVMPPHHTVWQKMHAAAFRLGNGGSTPKLVANH